MTTARWPTMNVPSCDRISAPFLNQGWNPNSRLIQVSIFYMEMDRDGIPWNRGIVRVQLRVARKHCIFSGVLMEVN